MSKLSEALRQRFRSPKEALKALGMDQSLLEETTEMPTLSTGALIIKSALFVKYPKLLAMDAQLTDVLKGVTGKRFLEQKKALGPALHGLLAADASLEHVHSFLDSLDKPEAEAKDLEANSGIPIATEPDPSDLARRAADAKRRLGRDETEEERKEREARDRAEDVEDAVWRKRAADARDRLGRDETPSEMEEREERESASDARHRMGRDSSEEERREAAADAKRRMGRDETEEERKKREAEDTRLRARDETKEEAEDRHAMDRMGRDRRRADDARRRADDSRRAADAAHKRAEDTKRAEDRAKADDARRHAEDAKRTAEDSASAADASRKRAADAYRRRAAKDNPPEFKGMPKPGGEMVTKGAMDAAIQEERRGRDTAIQEAVNGERRKQSAIHAAVRYCQGWVGAMDAAFATSEEQVYGKALEILGKNIEGMPAAAYRYVLDATPKPGERPARTTSAAALAMDSDTDDFFKTFPDAKNIRVSV